MSDIEVRPVEARAAAARVLTAAEAIQAAEPLFRSAGAEVAFAMRCAPVRWALTALVEELAGVPGRSADVFRTLARTDADAVEGKVAVDADGARSFEAIAGPVVVA
ncbi:hypothetical protein [Leifsonia sp. EB34]|uniref:hypothetical protein n=1 Tax=Leifsonia sp. EB34 TaxID=3156303 RepID=UPI003519BC94